MGTDETQILAFVQNHQLSTTCRAKVKRRRINHQPISTGFTQTSAIHATMLNAELTPPNIRRTLGSNLPAGFDAAFAKSKINKTNER
jgi:hypothetical protein